MLVTIVNYSYNICHRTKVMNHLIIVSIIFFMIIFSDSYLQMQATYCVARFFFAKTSVFVLFLYRSVFYIFFFFPLSLVVVVVVAVKIHFYIFLTSQVYGGDFSSFFCNKYIATLPTHIGNILLIVLLFLCRRYY